MHALHVVTSGIHQVMPNVPLAQMSVAGVSGIIQLKLD